MNIPAMSIPAMSPAPSHRVRTTLVACVATSLLWVDLAFAAGSSATSPAARPAPRPTTGTTMKEDFELPAVPVSRRYAAGQSIEARGRRWTVDYGSVDLMNQGNRAQVAAHDGRQLLELSGGNAGIVSTVVATRPGQRYALTVHYARHKGVARAIARGTVEVLGTGGKAYLRDDIEHDPLDLAFDAQQVYRGAFVADAASVTLRLSSSTNGNFGITVDGITLAPAP
jgi:hypothetical protein